MLLTPSEIRSAFSPWTPVVFFDDSYAKPTTDYLLYEYSKWFRGWLGGFGFSGWSRKLDCDKHARLYVAGLIIAHAQTSGPDADALAVGVVCYHSATLGAHAIVGTFTNDGLIFIDPQTCQRIALTPAELSSAFSVSF